MNTAGCVCVSDLRERQPFFHGPPLADLSKVTETRRSRAAMVHSALPSPPPPAD